VGVVVVGGLAVWRSSGAEIVHEEARVEDCPGQSAVELSQAFDGSFLVNVQSERLQVVPGHHRT
jgi:hypothetical protein